MAANHLKELALSDSGFVFDPFTGATFTVNATGLATLQALKEGLGRDAVEARLREKFSLPLSGVDPARDIDEFVLLLKQHNVLAADFSL